MKFTNEDELIIARFFKFIAPHQEAYKGNATFCYFAVKQGHNFVLIQGRVFLNTSPSQVPVSHFKSENIRVGCYSLSELDWDLTNVIEKITDLIIDTPDGRLLFPAGTYSASYAPFHPEGLRTQTRLNILTIIGSTPESLRQPDLDWEVKAAPTPYNVLQELLAEYRVSPTTAASNWNIEIVGFTAAAVDAANCTITGETATISVALARGLSPGCFSLGYGVYKDGSPTVRDVIPGNAFKWSQRENDQSGKITIKVPNAAVLNCVTVYKGTAQSQYWISDPSRLQNARRAVHEAFDPSLDTLRDIIARALRKGQDGRDLEAALAWLLWMLGFSVAQLGGTPRTQDAADLIATAPNGNFAVIECTTGLLKADNKLPTLHDRALAVRRALDTSGHAHLHVLPIIVTTKTRDEVKPDVDQAERLGILVVARENLEQMVDRTIRVPNADQIYDEAEQTMRAAQSKPETRDAADESAQS